MRIQDAVELDQVKQQQQQQHNSIVLNSSKASGSSNIDVAAQLLEKLDLSHAASVVSIPPPSESMLRLIDLCKRGKPDLFKEIVGVLDDNDHNHNNINAAATSAGTILPPDLFDRLPDDVGISLLHIAASSSQPQLVSYLLNLGADPSMRAIGRGGNTRPYDVAGDKDTREGKLTQSSIIINSHPRQHLMIICIHYRISISRFSIEGTRLVRLESNWYPRTHLCGRSRAAKAAAS